MTGTREFHDTIPVQRREPMPFEPSWYRRRCVAACYGACNQGHNACPTPDACRLAEDAQFGALTGIVKSWTWIAAAWVFIFAAVAVVWWLA